VNVIKIWLEFSCFELRMVATESKKFIVIIGHLLKMMHVKYVYSLWSAVQVPNCKAWLMLSRKPHGV
jgi:hypothetical protein